MFKHGESLLNFEKVSNDQKVFLAEIVKFSHHFQLYKDSLETKKVFKSSKYFFIIFFVNYLKCVCFDEDDVDKRKQYLMKNLLELSLRNFI